MYVLLLGFASMSTAGACKNFYHFSVYFLFNAQIFVQWFLNVPVLSVLSSST